MPYPFFVNHILTVIDKPYEFVSFLMRRKKRELKSEKNYAFIYPQFQINIMVLKY